MSVSLTSNFFRNARGLTLLDGGGITWSINANTNAISATVNGSNGNNWPISSGWGTPTGGSVVANFPGASATLGQTSEALAELIANLQSAGVIGS